MIPKYLSAVWAAIAPAMGNHLWQSTLCLVVAALLTLVLRKNRAQAPQTTAASLPSFEVASIKPNRSGQMNISIMFQPGRFTANGIPIKHLITLAYNVKDFQVSGGPSWINSEKYDIEAKEPDSVVQELDKLPPDQRSKLVRSMVQSLLADRFKLNRNSLD
jgi:hypothetical protein